MSTNVLDPSNVNTPQQLSAALDRFLIDPTSRSSPHALLAAVRAQAPVYRSGAGLWVVTGLESASALLRDPRISRWKAAKTELGISDAGDPELKAALSANTQMMINRDEPDHTRLRRLVRIAFLPASIEAWNDRVRQVSSMLVDRVVAKPEFDFLKEVAFPLPEVVICEMLGVPHADHALWSEWSHESVAANRTPVPTGDNLRRVQEATLAFHRYFKNLIAERRKALGDDLISTLLKAEAEGDKLGEDELIGTIVLLIQAGHETTANLLATGMYHVLARPDTYRSLCADPERTTQAVEEFLRFEGPAQFALPRMAREEISYGGVTIRAGDKLLFVLTAVNRDPTVFEDPDSLDIGRSNLHKHIAFGVGGHVCIGRQLALLEANIMFREIFRRLPDLELVETPTFAATFTRGLTGLKVRHKESRLTQ
jgi:cytochrome P450